MALLMISPLVLGFSAPKGFPAATSTAIRKLSLQAQPIPTGFTSPATVTRHTMKKKKLGGVRMSLRFTTKVSTETTEALHVWVLVPGVTAIEDVELLLGDDDIMIAAKSSANESVTPESPRPKFYSYNIALIKLNGGARFDLEKMTMVLEDGKLKIRIPKILA